MRTISYVLSSFVLVLTSLLLKSQIIISQDQNLSSNTVKIDSDTTSYCSPISLPIGQKINKTITLNLLLIEFQDVQHRHSNYPISLSLPAYTYKDFNNMLFSINTYCSSNMYSPDGENVYGSLRDYYKVMSNNNLDIVGSVLNNDQNNDDIPDWIMLDQAKNFYDDGRMEQFLKESKEKAKEKGLNIETNDSTFLAIIYAGHTYRSNTLNSLNPRAFFDEHKYIMGERFAAFSPYREERDDANIGSVAKFSHIGIHAHEFGHLLGFNHHGGGLDNQYWCLISAGNYNGPKNNGACPAPINPYLRWIKGWITIKSLNGNTTKKLIYRLTDPMVYKIKDDFSDNFFLIEFRVFNSRMALGENIINDYNSCIKNVSSKCGILIWRKLVGHFVKLLYSSGYDCSNGDNHLFPGNYAVRVISPWSDSRICKPGYYWVPNTKPSLNCGIEIISVERDNCIIDLYQKDPWKSSPSKPKNLVNISDSNVVLKWEKNNEPDLSYYKIYKLKSDSTYEQTDISYTNYYRDFNNIVNDSNNEKTHTYYKITAIDSTNKESVFSNEVKVEIMGPTGFNSNRIIDSIFLLHQNYPNPFNPTTAINYSIPKKSNVSLTVYDMLGSEVSDLVNKQQPQGNYEVEFDGSKFTSGIYFYRLQAGDFVETKKIILLK